MRLSESHSLPVPLAAAWAALNDLAMLQHALPGCESLVQIANDEFIGKLAIPLGFTTSHVTLHIQRRDVDAPHACTLHFETPTPVGGGSGSAAMRLTAQADDATTLQMDVAIELSGIVAQLSGPLIDIAAHQMAALFCQRLGQGALSRHLGNAIP